MPKLDGVEATRLIRDQHPEVQIIALTSFKEKEKVEGVLQAGAIGYLLKDVTADELAAAIRNAYAGRPTLAAEAMQALLARPVPTSTATRPTIGQDLTEREREVLAYMVQGHTNPEMAEKLILSLSTVKFHVSTILDKLQVATRSEAVMTAMKYKLVTSD